MAVLAALVAGVGLVGYNAYAAERPSAAAPAAELSIDLQALHGLDVRNVGGPREVAYEPHFLNAGPALPAGSGFTVTIQVDIVAGLRFIGFMVSRNQEFLPCPGTNVCRVNFNVAIPPGLFRPVFFYDSDRGNAVAVSFTISARTVPDPDRSNNTVPPGQVIDPGAFG